MVSGISPAAVQHAGEIPETRQFTAPASSPALRAFSAPRRF
jgi:hypothetical protein